MRAGFTLLEVLLAASITAVLAVLTLGAAAALARSAGDRSAEGVREARRARAVELLSADWRGRTALFRPADGSEALEIGSTSEPLGVEARRSAPRVRWEASPRGLRRRDAGGWIDLLAESVVLEAWDGASWRKDPGSGVFALRMLFSNPAEALVVR